MLALGEETAVQAVVGSIVWAFRRLKKPRCGEMSARGYALHSVCPQLSFLHWLHLTLLNARESASPSYRHKTQLWRFWIFCFSPHSDLRLIAQRAAIIVSGFFPFFPSSPGHQHVCIFSIVRITSVSCQIVRVLHHPHF